VEKKSTIPVLSHLLLETAGNEEIKITCTDYDVVLMDRCKARVETEGKAVLSGKQLYDIVKVVPPGDIDLDKAVGERVEIRAGTSRYELSGFDPDDFPRIEKSESEPGFKVPIAAFRKVLAKVSFCMSFEEARMNLNGVYFDVRKEDDGFSVTFVATDGHRLAKAAQLFPGAELPIENTGIIVHRKGITEIKKILDSETGDLFIGVRPDELVFRVGNAGLFVRRIDESFPDYESVIPNAFVREFKADTRELTEAMRRVFPMADPNLLTLKMEVRPETLRVSAANTTGGTAETTLFADYDGDPFVVAFNHRYLGEALTSIESPQAVVRVTEPGSPCLVEPSDPEEKVAYVLMPVEET
jgi:DNA polymerase-3 subunit beta